jgi:hypothetical protein
MVNKAYNRVGDLVLVHYENQPVVYARIEAIEPDMKKDWFQVSLTVLTIPLQTVTWILREEYIHGESFTMGGKAMKLERVESGAVPSGNSALTEPAAKSRGAGETIEGG